MSVNSQDTAGQNPNQEQQNHHSRLHRAAQIFKKGITAVRLSVDVITIIQFLMNMG
jgi:hypothetical protein